MVDSDSSSEAIPTSKKLLCGLVFTAMLLQYAGRTSVSVVLVQLQESTSNITNASVSKPHVGYSQFQVGVILSSVYAGMLPSSFIGGFLAYRYRAMRVLLTSVGINSVVHCLGPVMFQRFETAVTQRVLAGLAEGTSEPAAYGVLGEYMLPRQSARVAPFVFSGCLGIVWTIVSVGVEATGVAKKHEKDETAEKDNGKITNMKSVPFCRILTSGAVWALILLHVLSYTWDPNLLPLYFNQGFGTKVELAGMLAGIPILAFAALEQLFALFGNFLCKYVTTTVARKAMAVTVADANPFDIAPRYASVIAGLCRVLCRIVGLTFPLLVVTLTKNKACNVV
uniref:Major facilitator superfamily (MFS) profile domain-containing protein n=1 Tax=Branchiostoma floridae TaxID=7739 RepID=C3YMF0_BRAFL|eukprot:XP_002602732.1 hypothetical protein BRAFLDRAFT_72907 [Branchiostoma floridae]